MKRKLLCLIGSHRLMVLVVNDPPRRFYECLDCGRGRWW